MGRHIGIDVCKARLDVHVLETKNNCAFENNSSGIEKLIEWMKSFEPEDAVERLVLKATGGLEREAVDALLEAGLPVARVNSKRVRDFGKAMGFLAKTDALDAKLLAEFAQRIAPPPPSHAPEDPQAETLVSLVHRRRQISDMIVAEKNRLCRASAVVKRDIEAHLRWLKERLGEIDRRFDATIEVNDAWMAKAKDLSLH